MNPIEKYRLCKCAVLAYPRERDSALRPPHQLIGQSGGVPNARLRRRGLQAVVRGFLDERGLLVKDQMKAGGAVGRHPHDTMLGRERLALRGVTNTAVAQIAVAGKVTSAMVHYRFETHEKRLSMLALVMVPLAAAQSWHKAQPGMQLERAQIEGHVSALLMAGLAATAPGTPVKAAP